MSKLDSTITIQRELRPCIVDGKKGLFHTWEHCGEVVPPSPMVGGHAGGQLSCVFGLVEFESGKVERVEPHEILFVDNKFAEYAFPDPEG